MKTVERAKVAKRTHCVACENELIDGVCLNVNCPEAQATATVDATRRTRKATAVTRKATAVAVRESPRAWSSIGRVD